MRLSYKASPKCIVFVFKFQLKIHHHHHRLKHDPSLEIFYNQVMIIFLKFNYISHWAFVKLNDH